MTKRESILIFLEENPIDEFLRKKSQINDLYFYNLYKNYYEIGLRDNNKEYMEVGKLFFKYCYQYNLGYSKQ